MSIKATAVIVRESKVDPKHPRDKAYYAALQLFSEDGKEYGVTRYFGEFKEVGDLLTREAGVTYEELQGRYPSYEKGEEVRISLTLENEEAISKLGFNSKAA